MNNNNQMYITLNIISCFLFIGSPSVAPGVAKKEQLAPKLK